MPEIDRNAPATKGDIEDVRQEIAYLRSEFKEEIAYLRSEFKEDIAILRSEFKEDIAILRSEMQHMFDDLKEAFRDAQTEMLKAFYNFAQTNDVKVRDLAASDASIRERLSIVESRLTQVEIKLNMPPQL